MPEPSRCRRWIRRVRWLVLGCVAATLLYLTSGYILAFFGRLLDASDPPQATDYVMVLGGGRQTRPFAAAALINARLAKTALVPTVRLSGDTADGIAPSEHEIIIKVLRNGGVPAQAIVQLPGDVSNTFEEAQALAAFLETQPVCSVSVLTSNYHTRRASWIFRKVLRERFAQVRMAGVPTDGYSAANWWRLESGFVDYMQEYFKLAFYWLRY